MGAELPTAQRPRASVDQDRRSTAWLTADSWAGWQRRDRFAEQLIAARREEQSAAFEAATARWQLQELRARRGVRLALALSDARRVGLRRTMAACRAALRPDSPGPRPVEPEAAQLPDPLPRTVHLDLQAAFDQPQVRVGHLGSTARFAGCAPHVPLSETGWRETIEAGLDLIILEPASGDLHAEELTEIARAGRDVGAPVVLVIEQGALPVPPALLSSCDQVLVESLAGARTAAGGTAETEACLELFPPTVDAAVFNPIGWRHPAPDPVIALCSTPTPTSAAIEQLSTLPPGVRLVATPEVPEEALPKASMSTVRIDDPRDLLRVFRRASILVDHPSFHLDLVSASRIRAAAAASGLCVVPLEHAPAPADRDLLVAIGAATADRIVEQLLGDPDLLESVSIATRRAALEQRAHTARFRDLLGWVGITPRSGPRVSVVIATNRPHQLHHALESYRSQRYAPKELVLVLHGDGFEDSVPPEGLGEEVTVLRAPAMALLGDCLNLGIAASRGELIAKLDDDDHYGPDHLGDLVLAQRYSGADLVGKRVTFVHLAREGMTVRRPARRPERYTSHVSGPTMLMTAEIARGVGFRPLPKRVDSTLCERVTELGGSIYRTHNRDVILERHGDAHTWQVSDGDLTDAATAVRPGLDVEWASSVPGSVH